MQTSTNRLLNLTARVVWCCAFCVAGGCGTSDFAAPLTDITSPDSRSSSQVHVVRAGESLYTISMIFDLDYRNVATANNLRDPFVVYPGQRLIIPVLTGGASTTKGKTTVQAPVNDIARAPKPTPKAKPQQSTSRPRPKPPKPASPPRVASDATQGLRWRSPTAGRVVTTFKASGQKGIDIEGKRGQSVVASAAGKVVYSGSGLRGYGKLIIIKHNKRFLSAYAHNDNLLVKEGAIVKAGQQIARMGRSSDGRTVLHFEIRHDGKPVDPARYLPK